MTTQRKTPSSKPSEEDINAASTSVGIDSVSSVLWGGPHGPEGLVFVVARLTDIVDKLGKTVEKVTDQINGSDGVRNEVHELRADLNRLSQKVSRIEGVAWTLVSVLAVGGVLLFLAAGGMLHGHVSIQ